MGAYRDKTSPSLSRTYGGRPGAATMAAMLFAVCVTSVTGCGRGSSSARVATWRTDCPPAVRPAPLSVEAARQAYRAAERRHELRLREAQTPGFFLRTLYSALDPDRIAAGDLCLSQLDDVGELLFEHEYAPVDGLGGGRSARSPTGPFRRVHRGLFGGPETISCTSCHWVGGPNGAGAETDNAYLMGDGERIASSDARNPTALIALGVVQALAQEINDELHKQRADALRDAGRSGSDREIRLTAKGVDFGVLRVTADGKVDASGIRGVDADLVVKPFGWKGTFATIADFASDALQVHLGVQSDALLATAPAEELGNGDDRHDPDGDGVRDEISAGPFAALTVHLALLELPIVEPLVETHQYAPPAPGLPAPTTTSFADQFQRGRRVFHSLGCAGCHTPMMVLHHPILRLDGMPPIDLAKNMRRPALRYDPSLRGYPVWLFSDLKRHDMGKANAARHVQRGVPIEDYLTPRLWAVADSAPYLHDGRAPSFDYAIAGHDGEGAAARIAFTAAAAEDKSALRVYLMSLRRVPRVIVP
jgi:mono/diheme cytochrome c family protein